ncbi:MAG TPA: DNA sulfur modification protein DndE [Nitratidesulfovibrio sp.]|nr:DNA sulfur modification protein DndE [Nitratidesulfovibrio sp.]
MSETVHISQKAKEQLIWLKRQTGIRQWNILCRWAFCISVADMTPLDGVDSAADSNVDIPWKTFAGAHSAIYRALIAEWQRRVDPEGADDTAECVRKHVHRGVQRMMLAKDQSVGGLVRLGAGSAS